MNHPHKYSGVFHYADKSITFHFWLLSYNNHPPDTVLFLGAGQTGKIPFWIAQSAGENVVVVEGLPYWEAHPSGKDTADFSTKYTEVAFRVILGTFQCTLLNVIAESQASPASVILANTMPDKIGNLVLVRPLGLSVSSFGASDRARLKTFHRRMLRTALQFSQSLFHDSRNLWIVLIMIRTVLREPNLASFDRKYTIGVSYDLLEDCRQAAAIQLHKKRSFTILLGNKDKLFPPHEIETALQNAAIRGITVTTLPGVAHSSLAIKSSHALLQRAIATARR